MVTGVMRYISLCHRTVASESRTLVQDQGVRMVPMLGIARGPFDNPLKKHQFVLLVCL